MLLHDRNNCRDGVTIFVIIILHNENNRYGEYISFHNFRDFVILWFLHNKLTNILIAMLNYVLDIFYFCKRVIKKFQ